MIAFDDNTKTMILSVRDLAAEGAASAHLKRGAGFGGVGRMRVGSSIHASWQGHCAAVDTDYQREVVLKTQLALSGWTVLVSGRVDGLTIRDHRVVVQEIKSTQLSSAELLGREATDWPEYALQLRLYMWLLVRRGDHDPIGELLMHPLFEDSPVVVPVEMSLAYLQPLIERWLGLLIRRHEQRKGWLMRRQSMVFSWPFTGYRAGQESIRTAVELALEESEPILVSAATGLGKSVAVLTEALAFSVRTGRSLFWATSRNSGSAAALDAVRLLSKGSLRVAVIRAKEKMCLNDEVLCHPDACRFAKNYYQKRDDTDSIQTLHAMGVVTADAAMEVGRQAQICPHELVLDASDSLDVLIGDYNYVFDPQSRLKRLFSEGSKNWVLVVDEAHGLVGRVRAGLSPVLSSSDLTDDRFTGLDIGGVAVVEGLRALVVSPLLDGHYHRDGRALAQMPFLDLSDWLERGEERLMRGPVAAGFPQMLEALRRLVDHLRWSESQASGAYIDVASRRGGDQSLGSLCVDPSGWIADQLRSFGGCVLLSATLRPVQFFIDNFGLSTSPVRVIDAGSPFPQENQLVLRMGTISTRYRDRQASATAVAEAIESVSKGISASVIVYFSSYAALDVVARELVVSGTLLRQRPRMTESDRAEMLAILVGSSTTVVLLAVLGGSFSEAIDISAGVLDAVIVVGPALPPVGLEQTLLREHYQSSFGAGFLYASIVPGMSKVVQAAGRLIRRSTDTGVVVLVGERFCERDFSDQFPIWWKPIDVEDPMLYVTEHFRGESR